jgi:hypothetical protein
MKRKNPLKTKMIILAVLAVFATSGFFLIRHYFYMIDSFFYTAEFHYLFMQNNLKSGNLALFVDYFNSLGKVPSIFSLLLVGYFIQAFIVPLSGPVLVLAISSTVGFLKGFFLCYTSLLIVGISAFWIGTFFLGDIVPFLKKRFPFFAESLSNNILTYSIGALCLAVPFISIAFPVVLGAMLKVRFKGILFMLIVGIAFRLLFTLLFFDPASFNA